MNGPTVVVSLRETLPAMHAGTDATRGLLIAVNLTTARAW